MGHADQAAAVMAPRIGVLAPMHPLTVGAAAFNTAMVGALEQRCPVALVGWRRLYQPFLYRGPDRDDRSRPPAAVHGDPLLDWLNPLTWRAAIGRLDAFRASALVLPWIHAVMSPPYRWLLRHAPSGVRMVRSVSTTGIPLPAMLPSSFVPTLARQMRSHSQLNHTTIWPSTRPARCLLARVAFRSRDAAANQQISRGDADHGQVLLHCARAPVEAR